MLLLVILKAMQGKGGNTQSTTLIRKMETNQFIEELKSAQNLQYQACLRLIRENQRKQNEDVQSLIERLADDFDQYKKSLEEIISWHEKQREKAYDQAFAKLTALNPSVLAVMKTRPNSFEVNKNGR
jgi:hypothetical protein